MLSGFELCPRWVPLFDDCMVIQTSCTFDSSHSTAGTKWRLSVSYLTQSCLQNVKSLLLHPELHQIALMPQKTNRKTLILLSHTLAHLKLP